MKFELYEDTNSQWRWRLKAQNGEIIADSAESYHNKADCMNGITLVRRSMAAKIVEIVREEPAPACEPTLFADDDTDV